MKTTLRILTIVLAAAATFNQPAKAQKKTQKMVVSYVIDAPAEQIWQVVAEDYGAIANAHPEIVSSNYINGSLKAGEGAERVCNFNEKGTQFLKEKMVDYDPVNYTFKNVVYQSGKFPLDPENTFAIYRVETIDANTSRLVFDFTFRTKPAFMGVIAKGDFKKRITNYAISVAHYVKTGEKVNKENFKQIKKQYS